MIERQQRMQEVAAVFGRNAAIFGCNAAIFGCNAAIDGVNMTICGCNTAIYGRSAAVFGGGADSVLGRGAGFQRGEHEADEQGVGARERVRQVPARIKADSRPARYKARVACRRLPLISRDQHVRFHEADGAWCRA
eukprot:777338-Rhodomonas_salina.1